MIIITGRQMAIPIDEKTIGFTGDNKVETRTILLPAMYNGTDLSGFDFKLDAQVGTTKNVIDLTKSVSADTISLLWEIEESQLTASGLMYIQVRAFNGTVEKWHSYPDKVIIESSIDAESSFPAVLPSEYTQMEARVTALKNATDANATAAALSETNAAGSAGTALEQARAASLNKDETDINAGLVAQDKQTVAADKEIVAQDKEDVLAAEQRVITLMSTDARSYYKKTIAERDAIVGLRHCDRCSVLETKADYIYDAENIDGDEVNPEWILTSEWDALKTVAWEVITGKPEIVNNLTAGGTTAPLSAEQGKTLKSLVDAEQVQIDDAKMLKNLSGCLAEGLTSPVIQVVGDSTGVGHSRFPYLLAQQIASKYPTYNVKYKDIVQGTLAENAWVDVQHVGDDRHVYVSYPGSTSYYFGLNGNECALRTSADIEIIVNVALDNWHDTVARYLISDVGTEWSWSIFLSSNILQFYWSTDGTTGTLKNKSTHIDTTSWANGEAHWIKVVLDADTGGGNGYAVSGYTSSDGVTWTLAGTTTGSPATTLWKASSQAASLYTLGGKADIASSGDILPGKYYEVHVNDGIGGIDVIPQPIESWHRMTSGTPAASYGGTPTAYIYNTSSVSGTSCHDWTAAAYMYKLMPKTYGATVLINLGHNDIGFRTNTTYLADWTTLIALLKARAVSGNFAYITQAPFNSPEPADYIFTRSRIRQFVMGIMQENNIPCIDTYTKFVNDPRGLSVLIDTDGVHPSDAAGSPFLRDIIAAYINLNEN